MVLTHFFRAPVLIRWDHAVDDFGNLVNLVSLPYRSLCAAIAFVNSEEPGVWG
jgi:hypothetical protein